MAQGPRNSAMTGLALFRIALGTAAWVAPRRLTPAFGLPEERITPELDYMNRVFGVRAISLGVGYLASAGDARRLWHRLWLLCETADTAIGAAMVARGQLSGPSGAAALSTTGLAMAIDVAALR